jgi:amino acid transporter
VSEAVKPPRAVGTIGAVLLSLNSVIGAGIFALPALLYAATGDFAPWMFLIFALFHTFTVLIGARLATMFEASGGAQLYAQVAFGPLAGFLVGWLSVLGWAAGRGAALAVLVAYLAVFFPALADPLAQQLAIFVLILALCGVSLAGMRNAVNGLALGTVFKLVPILILCGVAYASGGIAVSFTPPSFGKFESVALLVYYALSGTLSVNTSAGEIKDPRRTLPRSMLMTLAGTTLFYMAVQWAYIAAGAPVSSGDATPLAAAAGAVMGQAGVVAITLAAIFSIATNSLASFLLAPRVLFGMAERGLLPPVIAHVSRRFLVPDAAILLFTFIAALISFSGAFPFLATVTVLAARISNLAMVASFVRFQLQTSRVLGGGMTPRWTLAVTIAFGFGLYVCAQAPPLAFALLVGLLLVGVVLFKVAKDDRVVSPEPIRD